MRRRSWQLIDAEIEALRDPLESSAHPVVVRPRPPGQAAAQARRQLHAAPAARQSSRRAQGRDVDGQGRHRPRATSCGCCGTRRRRCSRPSRAVPEVEEITITVDGGYTQSSGSRYPRRTRRTNAPGLEFGVQHHFWQLKDRSASGCRLRAPSPTPRRCLPARSSPFATTKRCAGRSSSCAGSRRASATAIDIGVEYVGQNPRGVTMAARWPCARDCRTDRRTDKAGVFTAALSARKRRSSRRCLSRRSSCRATAVRPAIALPDAAVGNGRVHRSPQGADRGAGRFRLAALRGPRAPRGRPSGPGWRIGATDRPSASPRPPPPLDDGAPTDWLIPQFGKRAGSA